MRLRAAVSVLVCALALTAFPAAAAAQLGGLTDLVDEILGGGDGGGGGGGLLGGILGGLNNEQLAALVGLVKNPLCEQDPDLGDNEILNLIATGATVGICAATYEIHSESATLPPKTIVAAPFVPTAVNVDADPLNDFTVTLLPTSPLFDKFQLKIERLPGAIGRQIPVSLEAVVRLPATVVDRDSVNLGFDARGKNAPNSFVADISLPDAPPEFPEATVLGLTVNSDAGKALAVLGGQFDGPTPQAGRMNKVGGVLAYDKVPTPVGALLTFGDEAFKVEHTAAPVSPSPKLTVDAETCCTYKDADGNVKPKHLKAHAEIENVPAKLNFDVLPQGAKKPDGSSVGQKIVYSASAPLVNAYAKLTTDYEPGERDHLEVDLDGLPAKVTVDRPTPDQATITPEGGPIGYAKVGASSNVEPQYLTSPGGYVHNFSQGETVSSFAAEAHKIQSIVFSMNKNAKGDFQGMSVDQTLAEPLKQQFQVRAQDGIRVVDGRLSNLPKQVGVDVDLAAGKIDYDGFGEKIDWIEVNGEDPRTAFFEGARYISARIEKLPEKVCVEFSPKDAAAAAAAAPCREGQKPEDRADVAFTTTSPVGFAEVLAQLEPIESRAKDLSSAMAENLSFKRIIEWGNGGRPGAIYRSLTKYPGGGGSVVAVKPQYTDYTLGGRIYGLSSVTVDETDSRYQIDTKLGEGDPGFKSRPLRVILDGGGETMRAYVTNVPGSIGLTLDPKGGLVKYDGSEELREIFFDAKRKSRPTVIASGKVIGVTEPYFERATRVDGYIQGFPTFAELTFGKITPQPKNVKARPGLGNMKPGGGIDLFRPPTGKPPSAKPAVAGGGVPPEASKRRPTLAELAQTPYAAPVPDTGFRFEATKPIGEVRVSGTNASDPADLGLKPGYAGLVMRNHPEKAFVAGGRVFGLRRAELTQLISTHPLFKPKKSMQVSTEIKAGPLTVILEDGEKSIKASAIDAPDKITKLLIDSINGRIAYEGSRKIGRIEARIMSQPGAEAIFERATQLVALVKGFPKAASVRMAPTKGGVATFEASTPIPSIEMLASDVQEPGKAIADIISDELDKKWKFRKEPGLVYRDVTRFGIPKAFLLDYRLGGRVLGLKSASFGSKPGITLSTELGVPVSNPPKPADDEPVSIKEIPTTSVDAAPIHPDLLKDGFLAGSGDYVPRPFNVVIDDRDQWIHGRVDKLPQSIDMTIDTGEEGRPGKVTYDASAEIPKITVLGSRADKIKKPFAGGIEIESASNPLTDEERAENEARKKRPVREREARWFCGVVKDFPRGMELRLKEEGNKYIFDPSPPSVATIKNPPKVPGRSPDRFGGLGPDTVGVIEAVLAGDKGACADVHKTAKVPLDEIGNQVEVEDATFDQLVDISGGGMRETWDGRPFRAFVRFKELAYLEIADDPLAVKIEGARSQPFTVNIAKPPALDDFDPRPSEIDVAVLNLPRRFAVTQLAEKRLRFDGDQPIGDLKARIRGLPGEESAEDVRNVNARLTDIPLIEGKEGLTIDIGSRKGLMEFYTGARDGSDGVPGIGKVEVAGSDIGEPVGYFTYKYEPFNQLDLRKGYKKGNGKYLSFRGHFRDVKRVYMQTPDEKAPKLEDRYGQDMVFAFGEKPKVPLVANLWLGGSPSFLHVTDPGGKSESLPQPPEGLNAIPTKVELRVPKLPRVLKVLDLHTGGVEMDAKGNVINPLRDKTEAQLQLSEPIEDFYILATKHRELYADVELANIPRRLDLCLASGERAGEKCHRFPLRKGSENYDPPKAKAVYNETDKFAMLIKSSRKKEYAPKKDLQIPRALICSAEPGGVYVTRDNLSNEVNGCGLVKNIEGKRIYIGNLRVRTLFAEVMAGATCNGYDDVDEDDLVGLAMHTGRNKNDGFKTDLIDIVIHKFGSEDCKPNSTDYDDFGIDHFRIKATGPKVTAEEYGNIIDLSPLFFVDPVNTVLGLVGAEVPTPTDVYEGGSIQCNEGFEVNRDFELAGGKVEEISDLDLTDFLHGCSD